MGRGSETGRGGGLRMGAPVACLMYAPPPRRQTRRRRDAAPQCRYRAFRTITSRGSGAFTVYGHANLKILRHICCFVA